MGGDANDAERRQWRRLQSLESRLFQRPPAHYAGRFRIDDVVGSGALAVVFRGFDPERQRVVAIKVLRRNPALQANLVSRFLRREAKALGRLSHPNVVAVLGVEQLDTTALPNDVDGEVGLIMEFIDGPSVRAWLGERSRTAAEVVGVFLQAAEGLRAAHDASVLHRDFKPGNVMLDARGNAQVLDFGLGRMLEGATPSTLMTLRGMLDSNLAHPVGTPLYMAPEVHAGASGSPASDQYSFCVALHEALLGRVPFQGATLQQLEAAKLTEQPRFEGPGKRLSAPLRKLLKTGLRAYPDERHASMTHVIEALAQTPEAGGPSGLRRFFT